MREFLVDHSPLDVLIAGERPVIWTVIDANTQRLVGFSLVFDADTESGACVAMRCFFDRSQEDRS